MIFEQYGLTRRRRYLYTLYSDSFASIFTAWASGMQLAAEKLGVG